MRPDRRARGLGDYPRPGGAPGYARISLDVDGDNTAQVVLATVVGTLNWVRQDIEEECLGYPCEAKRKRGIRWTFDMPPDAGILANRIGVP